MGPVHAFAGPRPDTGPDRSTLRAAAPAAPRSATARPAAPAVGGGTEFAEAFPALYLLAYQVAYRVLGDRGDSEDVAQEALARAALRWARLAERPNGWVVRVAGNLAIDRYRRRRRLVLTAVEARPTADLTVGERLDLAKALSSLPRRQRQAVVLRYLADWSEQDVARELGCSVGTVKSSCSRGIRALRRRLGTAPPAAPPGGPTGGPHEGDGDVAAP